MIKRIRPARAYQSPDNAALKLMNYWKSRVARDLRDELEHLSVLVPDNVENLIASGRWREIVGTIDLDHWRETLKKTFGKIADAFRDGAELGVRKINGSFHRYGRRVRFSKAADVFAFDMFDEETQAILRRAQDTFIVQLGDGVRDTIEQIVLTGARDGMAAADIVDDIRSLIGLTDTQSLAVLNFRRMLTNLDPTALDRQLRNRAFDALFGSAIENDTPLGGSIIDEMVNAYRENYLTYRAKTIAQTESVRAVSLGLRNSYQQAISRGALPEDAVRREWELGDMPCPICESIPDNNPNGVGVNEDFISDEGPVSDPPVHPNCQCSVNYITDISKVPEEDTESGSYDTNTPVTGFG